MSAASSGSTSSSGPRSAVASFSGEMNPTTLGASYGVSSSLAAVYFSLVPLSLRLRPRPRPRRSRRSPRSSLRSRVFSSPPVLTSKASRVLWASKSGMISMETPNSSSKAAMLARRSLRRCRATFTGSCPRILAPRGALTASSWMRRTMVMAATSVLITKPEPLQVGQVVWVLERRRALMRCRDISKRPNREMRPTSTRALSRLRAFLRIFSTSRRCLLSPMSMKSMTNRPPTSRRRTCRATIFAASRFVSKAI